MEWSSLKGTRYEPAESSPSAASIPCAAGASSRGTEVPIGDDRLTVHPPQGIPVTPRIPLGDVSHDRDPAGRHEPHLSVDRRVGSDDRRARHAMPVPPAELYEVEAARISREELTPLANEWVRQYRRVGRRSEYLWKWAQYCIGLITLPCVPEQWRAHAGDTKFLSAMMNVLIDDVADQQKNGPLLTELLRVSRLEVPDPRNLSIDDRPYLELACRVWREYWQRVATYPCYPVYAELLRFDLQQLFNAMHYSYLVQRSPFLLNGIEDDLYSPRTMMIQSFATVDLICTPGFRVEELGRLREAMSHAECMARIGNNLGTWRREVVEGDFNNGVFVQAVAKGDLRAESLTGLDVGAAERLIAEGGHEQHLLNRWWHHRNRLLSLADSVSSVDLRQVADSFRRLLLTELGSRGHK